MLGGSVSLWIAKRDGWQRGSEKSLHLGGGIQWKKAKRRVKWSWEDAGKMVFTETFWMGCIHARSSQKKRHIRKQDIAWKSLVRVWACYVLCFYLAFLFGVLSPHQLCCGLSVTSASTSARVTRFLGFNLLCWTLRGSVLSHLMEVYLTFWLPYSHINDLLHLCMSEKLVENSLRFCSPQGTFHHCLRIPRRVYVISQYLL